MRYKNIVKEWDKSPNRHNQWSELSEEEKIEYAFRLGNYKNFEDGVCALGLKRKNCECVEA